MNEAVEFPTEEQRPFPSLQERQVVTARGRNTERLTSHPEKGKAFEGLAQRPYEFSLFNPGEKTGILILPAFGGHTGGIGLNFNHISQRYNATIVTTQHPPWTFHPDFAIAQFEDLMEEQEFKDVVLVGPSLGGSLGLAILRDYQQRHGFPFEVKGLVTLGTPTCRADLKPAVLAKLTAAIGLRRTIVAGRKLQRSPEKVLRHDATGAEQTDAEFHGQIARAWALLRRLLKKGEYPNIPVLALTLPPGKDQTVKDSARERIKELFPQTTFDTFDAREHSQEEYVTHAKELARKIGKFLDTVLKVEEK